MDTHLWMVRTLIDCSLAKPLDIQLQKHLPLHISMLAQPRKSSMNGLCIPFFHPKLSVESIRCSTVIYPQVIYHSHGKLPLYRWCSHENFDFSGIFQLAMSATTRNYTSHSIARCHCAGGTFPFVHQTPKSADGCAAFRTLDEGRREIPGKSDISTI